MQTNITIRESHPEDASGIFDVARETWVATYPNGEISKEDIEEFFDKRFSVEKVRSDIENKPDDIGSWVAEVEDKIVGFCIAMKKGMIKSIYVKPEYQGKGIGAMMMRVAMRWIGDKEITIPVAVYNTKAIEFYKKFGFKETEVVNNIPIGNKIITEVNMVK